MHIGIYIREFMQILNSVSRTSCTAFVLPKRVGGGEMNKVNSPIIAPGLHRCEFMQLSMIVCRITFYKYSHQPSQNLDKQMRS